MENNTTIFKELKAGTTLADGKFVIEGVLGVGGFGITYKARHAELDQYFAIKEFFINGYCVRHTQRFTIHLQGMDKDLYVQYRKKFVEEAQTLAKLDHPNIVRVTDVFDENGTSYFVMPLLQGETLQKLVERKGVLPYEVGVNYMGQICEALDYIHNLKPQILHRDVKPENIIITPDNRAILIDFGSAREFVHDQIQSQTILFTPGYASPEQYTKTGRKGSYSDVYSVGATFYFIVTGKIPIDAAARLLEDFEEPKKIAPNLSGTANKTILKAMEIKPENRYQTVNELMRELTGVEDWKTPAIEVVVQKGISKKVIFGIILGLIVLLAAAGIWYLQHDKQVKTRVATENMLNGNVENLKVWIYDGVAYLRPTQGILDTTTYYGIDGKIAQYLPRKTLVRAYLYTGQMQNGFPHGDGHAVYQDGSTYTGSFEKGLRHGRSATFIDADGAITYIGSYRNDQRHGSGKLIRHDGVTFEGVWGEGLVRSETGRIYGADGKLIQERRVFVSEEDLWTYINNILKN